MSNKYYAVKQGRKIGVLNSWTDCKESVEGFSNAVYKAFSDYNEAYKFVFGENRKLENKKIDVFAYIDGSYDNSKKAFSYAGIIFNNGKKTTFSDASNNKELAELRNVAGELYAAMFVMNYAKQNNIKDIIIYYDYAGIEMWATDKWKANLKFTKEYALYAKQIMKDINIIFKKVKAHSGIEYNEEVDKLAKVALQKLNNNDESRINNENDIFLNIKGNKASAKINIFTGEYLISPEEVLNIIKVKWKKNKRNIKEIEDIKICYDIIKNQFITMVITEKEENIIIIEGSEFDGKK